MNVKRLQSTLEQLNQFGYSDNGINRLAYTKVEQQAITFLITQFEKEGMTVKVDAIGNVIARREGTKPSLPAVACGSHIDTVYDAGRYDGTVGVIAGLEVVRYLNEHRIQTKHPIEVIVFACEESARFGVATIGSKVMTGLYDKADLFSLKDKDGISLQSALHACGLQMDQMDKAQRHKEEIKVFYELHVEQGPVLEKAQKQIGIVTGIAAPTRFKLDIKGQAAHSGSTPMYHRQDAFSGAAEIALALEKKAREESVHGTVATVGNCEVKAGAMNVVPGHTEMLIDIRSISASSKQRVVDTLQKIIQQVEADRQLQINVTTLADEQPTCMDDGVIASLKVSCEKCDFSYMELPSGAGHDAMNMAKVYPTGMIFVPSKDGLSHNKNEYTTIEEIASGATLLKEAIVAAAVESNKAYCEG